MFRPRFTRALFIFWIGGLWSVAIDADHWLVPVLCGQWPMWDNLAGRPLHWPLVAFCGTLCIVFGSLFSGLLLAELLQKGQQ